MILPLVAGDPNATLDPEIAAEGVCMSPQNRAEDHSFIEPEFRLWIRRPRPDLRVNQLLIGGGGVSNEFPCPMHRALERQKATRLV